MGFDCVTSKFSHCQVTNRQCIRQDYFPLTRLCKTEYKCHFRGRRHPQNVQSLALNCFAKKKEITKDRKKERKMLPSGAWPIYGCQNAKIRTVSKKEKEKKNTESRSRDLQYSIGFRSTGITEHKPKLNRHRIKEAPSCSSSWLQKRQREEMLHKAETQQSHKIQLSSLYREGVETFLGLETQARKAKKIKNKIL